jgi:hypothetical protein
MWSFCEVGQMASSICMRLLIKQMPFLHPQDKSSSSSCGRDTLAVSPQDCAHFLILHQNVVQRDFSILNSEGITLVHCMDAVIQVAPGEHKMENLRCSSNVWKPEVRDDQAEIQGSASLGMFLSSLVAWSILGHTLQSKRQIVALHIFSH